MNGRIGHLSLIAGLAAGLNAAASGQTLDQSRAYSSELLSDASSRTSSLAPAAKDFTVNVHGFTQFRYNWNYRQDDALEDNSTVGFQNARTKINLSGNIADEKWGYYIQWKFEDPSEGSAALDDVYGTYTVGNGWKVQFGQFKVNLFREENMGDTTQLFANRSVENSVFSQKRSQGVQFAYESDSVQFFGAFTDGINTANTDFTSSKEADWALTGRVNWKWAGDWKQGKDFTSFRNSSYFGLLGGGVHYQQGGDTFGTLDTDVLAATIDAQVEGNGWNVFAALCYSNTDPGVGDSVTDYGFVVQGGIFVSEDSRAGTCCSPTATAPPTTTSARSVSARTTTSFPKATRSS